MEIRTTPIVVGPPHITPTTIDFDTMRERGENKANSERI